MHTQKGTQGEKKKKKICNIHCIGEKTRLKAGIPPMLPRRLKQVKMVTNFEFYDPVTLWTLGSLLGT